MFVARHVEEAGMGTGQFGAHIDFRYFIFLR
jgi:hypothetical protein